MTHSELTKIDYLSRTLKTEIERITKGKIPKVAITLGSGLADTFTDAKDFTLVDAVNCAKVTALPKFTAEGHKLEILIVEENKTKTLLLIVCGRKHIYEIDDVTDVAEAIRIPRALASIGIETFIHTSAVGGIDPIEPGKLISVLDHDGDLPHGLFTGNKNLLPEKAPFESMFVDCQDLYYELPLQVYAKHAKTGTLQWHRGGMFETKAQIRRLKLALISGVGMSMFPEALAIQYLKERFPNLRNIGIGVVTNPAAGLGGKITDEEVKEKGKLAIPNLLAFLVDIIEHLAEKK